MFEDSGLTGFDQESTAMVVPSRLAAKLKLLQ